MPIGVDWLAIRPAVLAFLHGANPYLVGEGFGKVYEPFWTYILLAPLALLPYWTSRIFLFVVSLASFGYTAIRLGGKSWQVIMFVMSFPVMGCLMTGNIDWLVLSGLWMPPQIGLFFVLMKPQVGIAIAIFWAFEAWRTGGARQVLRTFCPVTLAFLCSFAVYGFWLFQFQGMDVNPERITGFPFVVPIGLFLVYRAVKDRDKELARVPGPFLAPYVSQFNYATVLAGLFSRPRVFVAAWLLLWSIMLVRFAMG